MSCSLTLLTIRLYLRMVQRMVTQLDHLLLLHRIHINVDYLTMPLFVVEIKAIDLAFDHTEQSENTDLFFFLFSLCSAII